MRDLNKLLLEIRGITEEIDSRIMKDEGIEWWWLLSRLRSIIFLVGIAGEMMEGE